jgi:hypothetical protein
MRLFDIYQELWLRFPKQVDYYDMMQAVERDIKKRIVTCQTGAGGSAQVPPIPMGTGDDERKYATQTCTNKRLHELEGEKNRICNNMAGQSCSGQSDKKLAKIPCSDIIARIYAILACMSIRSQIYTECFGGNIDSGHQKQNVDLANGLANCRGLAASNCPAGSKIP